MDGYEKLTIFFLFFGIDDSLTCDIYRNVGLQAIRQRPFQVLAGDSFSTTCIYDAKTPTVFGKASVEEMCLFSILYYPAKQILGQRQWACGVGIPLSSCNATYESNEYSVSDSQLLSPLEIDTFYERTFGSLSSNQCSSRPPLQSTEDDTTSSSPSLYTAPMNMMISLLGGITMWYAIFR
jgi:hypothetical protein